MGSLNVDEVALALDKLQGEKVLMGIRNKYHRIDYKGCL